MSRVWYVAYGSNLGTARFRCYLAGGRPEGGSRTYDGCRDPSEPADAFSLELPGTLVFAGSEGSRHPSYVRLPPSGRPPAR